MEAVLSTGQPFRRPVQLSAEDREVADLERPAIPATETHEPVLLQVEDDDGAAYLFQMALRQTALRQFFRVRNGEDAMAFATRRWPLLQEGAYRLAPRSDLVLLDLG